MRTFSATAPGKVVLSGEYAVLDGAPAVCMAVDRRAQAIVTRVRGDYHRVSTPQHANLEGRFVEDGESLNWLQGADEFTIVDAVWQAVKPSGVACLSIELNSGEFVDPVSAEKIGIGSSAAITVALAAALSQSSDVLGHATRAHHVFQHRTGSGADIATSVAGGLIEYRMKDSTIAPLCWPDGLACRLIWTGVAASTRNKLKQLEASDEQGSRKELSNAAGSMAKAWRSASTVMSEYPAYIETLRQFSVDHELGIFDAGHGQLVVEAAAAGLVYKPCGAGGGDVGVLLGFNNDELDDFMNVRAASGCKILDCELEPVGIELEQS